MSNEPMTQYTDTRVLSSLNHGSSAGCFRSLTAILTSEDPAGTTKSPSRSLVAAPSHSVRILRTRSRVIAMSPGMQEPPFADLVPAATSYPELRADNQSRSSTGVMSSAHDPVASDGACPRAHPGGERRRGHRIGGDHRCGIPNSEAPGGRLLQFVHRASGGIRGRWQGRPRSLAIRAAYAQTRPGGFRHWRASRTPGWLLRSCRPGDDLAHRTSLADGRRPGPSS